METSRYLKIFGPSSSIKITNDCKHIAHISNKIYVYRVENMESAAIFGQIKNPVHLQFSNNSALLAVKTTSGRVGIYDLNSLTYLKSYTPTMEEGCNLVFSACNRFIVSGDWEGNITMIDLENARTTVLKNYRDCMIDYVAYNIDDDAAVFLITRKSSFLRSHYPFFIKWKFPFLENDPVNIELTAPRLEWKKIIYNCTQKCYILCDDSNTLVIMDSNLKKILYKVIPAEVRNLESMDLSADGRYIAVADLNRFVRIYGLPDFRCVKEYPLAGSLHVEFSSDGRYLLIGTARNGYFIDVEDSFGLEGEDSVEVIYGVHPTAAEDKFVKMIEKRGLTGDLLAIIPEDIIIDVIARVALNKSSGLIRAEDIHMEKALMRLPQGLRIIYATWWFELEVAEGGMMQYFGNATYIGIQILQEAMHLLKATQTTQLISKALKVYEKELVRYRGVGGSNAGATGIEFIYTADWERLDREYNILEENLDDLRLKYLRDNLGEF